MNISEIENILPRYQEIADGDKKSFNVAFDLIDTKFVSVYLGSDKQTSGFNIDVENKEIVFDSAPSSGLLVTIVRAVPVSWESTLHGAINSTSINRLLTHIIASIQTVQEEVSRAVKSNVYDQNEGGQLSEFFLKQLTDAQDILNRSENTLSLLNTTTQNALSSVETASSTALSSIGSAKDSALASMEGLVTSAKASETNAKASASAAKASADKAKETADSIVNNSADKDLSNLSTTGQAKFDAKQNVANLSQAIDTSTTKYPCNNAVKAAVDTKQDIATAVNYDNITNCITEIPQDIKLELNNGKLTLKAGSTYYKCDGSFTKVTTSQDYSITNVSNGYRLVFFTGNGFDIPNVIDCNSGTSEPTTGNKWFNTSNNILYSGGSGNWQQKTNYSLPLAIITVSDGTITSIDQVFNGFGYIGSTVFVLPGVKGLIPNGRNEDGSLKNIEFTVSKVLTTNIYNCKYLLNSKNLAPAYFTNYAEQDEQPAFVNGEWYQPSTNTMYQIENSNPLVTDVMYAFDLSASDGRATGLTPKLPFRAVDYSEYAREVGRCAKLDADNTFTGNNTFKNNQYFNIPNITLGTAPSSNTYRQVKFTDSARKEIAVIDYAYFTSKEADLRLIVRNPNNTSETCFIQVGYTSSGVPRVNVSTDIKTMLSAADNSSNIPTTYWVNSRITSVMDSKWQKVDSLPSSPDSGVFYYIPE